MKVTGIIAEYNPFHNGHLYQLKTAKETWDTDFIIVVLSGDFMQRGIPGILNKWKRTKMALACGADLVLELPVLSACASAEPFAAGGVVTVPFIPCPLGAVAIPACPIICGRMPIRC